MVIQEWNTRAAKLAGALLLRYILWTRRSYFRLRTFNIVISLRTQIQLLTYGSNVYFDFNSFSSRARSSSKMLSDAKHWPGMVHTPPCNKANVFPSCRPPYVRHNSANAAIGVLVGQPCFTPLYMDANNKLRKVDDCKTNFVGWDWHYPQLTLTKQRLALNLYASNIYY